MRSALLIFGIVAIASGAHATDYKKPALHGDYYFYTYAEKNGRPVCSETWRFGEDGTLTIRSGQEIATNHFRTEPGEKIMTVLFRSFVSSNGQPDCSGAVNSHPPPGAEERLESYFAQDGGIVLCEKGMAGSTPVLRPIGHLFAAKSN